MEIQLIKRLRPPYAKMIFLSSTCFVTAYFIYAAMAQPIFAIAVCAFGALIPVLLWTKSHDAQGLLINDQGIYDRRLGMGVIPWRDIAEATIESRYEHDFLAIKLREPQVYIARLPLGKRKKVQGHFDLGFTAFMVEVSRLNVNKYELLKFVKTKIEPSRSSTGTSA